MVSLVSMLESQLHHIGLSENEARVYLASLELGPSTVLRISEKARIKRPTAYVAIEELMRLGLMSSFQKAKKRYFSSEDPERLLDIIGDQKRELSLKEKSAGEILPELVSLFNISEKKPRVRFFEGKEGLRSIQNDMRKTESGELLEFVDIDSAYELFPPGPADHRQKMAKKFRSIKVIYTSSKGPFLPRRESSRQRRFIPPEKFPFSVEINIYGSKIAIASCKGVILGVIIESEEIARTMRSIFHLSWDAAETYNR